MRRMFTQRAKNMVLALGKFLKTDALYVLKGGTWLSIGQGLSALLALLLSIAFARLVPKEIYGEYKFILSLATIIGVFSLSGTAAAVTQATAAGFDGTILIAKKQLLRFNALLLPVSSIISLYYYTQGNITVAIGLLVIGVTAPIITTYNLFNGFLLGKKDFRKSTIANTTITSFTTIVLIVAMLSDRTSPLVLSSIYFFITAVGTMYFYKRTIAEFTPDPTRIDPRATIYGAHLSVMNVFSIIASQIDKIVVYHFLGPIQLAIYSFAQAIPDQMRGVLKSMNTLMLPRFTGRSDKELMSSLWRKMALFGTLITIGVIVYVCLAPMIFRFLFPQYSESVLFSQVVALSLIAFTANVPATAVQSRMDKRILYTFNISLAILQILLIVILTPLYGLWGAIISIVASRYYSFFFWLWITFTISRKHTDPSIT